MAEAATLLDELDVLIEKGIYKDRESLVRDAMRSLLRSKPELRGQLAVELYRQGRVSLSRAAEIGGIDMESFKELLREAGVARVIPPVGGAIENEVEQLFATNDSAARRFAQDQGVQVISLQAILRGLWLSGTRSKGEVKELLERIKKADYLEVPPEVEMEIFSESEGG